MKKSLIGTSALVTASLIAGAAVAADAPASNGPITLSIGGFGSSVVGYASQDKKFLQAYGEKASKVDVKGDNEIHFKGRANLTNGLTVAVKYELEAGGTSKSVTRPVDKYSVSLGGGFGTIMAGVDDTALTAIAKRAPHMGGRLFGAGISEGALVSGDWVFNPLNKISEVKFVSSTSFTRGGISFDNGQQLDGLQTLAKAGAIDSSYIHTGSGTESVSYFSPSFAGFTAALTYVPDSNQDRHDAKQPVGKFVSEAYAVGLGYQGSFNGIDLAADIGWLKGGSTIGDKATDIATPGDFGGLNGQIRSRNRNEYQAGLNVSHSGVTVGGGYHLAKEKLGYTDSAPSSKESKLNLESSAWEAGVGYKTGPYGVALAYLSTSQGKVKGQGVNFSPYETRAVQLTAEYTLSPGIMLVGGVGHVSFEGKDANKKTPAALKNEGWVAATGLSLAF